MAAPATATVRDLSGSWHMNKKYCGDTDGVLALQGIGWLTRKGIGMASVTQVTTSYPDADDPSKTHIDFTQVVTGGIKGTTELRTLDWKWRAHTDHLFGDLKGRSQFTKLAKLEEAVKEVKGGVAEDAKFMAEGWDEATKEGEVVEAYVENEKGGWVAWQIWGFVDWEADGKKERRHVRRVVVRKGKEVKRILLVFDWVV
ncbi:hypothetical protein BU16DRAFT_455320 [Lophium mytilinum]|uniref:Lipocalin-like domain-containing protein n=1 Tax=Lophium mytilinum TaxID=390894 RepID=A0A6A6R124_9PEZI|nr:hypothetical protein BU16DRAFT_455320 [Lophium mytilinum]